MSASRVAVISGASRGLGKALADEFTANNWQVVGTGRSNNLKNSLQVFCIVNLMQAMQRRVSRFGGNLLMSIWERMSA